jgi:hypothetical protein
MEGGVDSVSALLKELRQRKPEQVVRLCHVVYLPPKEGKGPRFLVNVLSGSCVLNLESGLVTDSVTHKLCPPKLSSLLIKYLAKYQGGRPVGWVQLDKFPGGQALAGDLSRRAFRPLIDNFGGDAEGFDASSRALDGEKERLGGLSYSFSLFPMIKILIQLWTSDERTYRPPTANFMFSTSYLGLYSAQEAVDSAEFLVSELIKVKRRGAKAV